MILGCCQICEDVPFLWLPRFIDCAYKVFMFSCSAKRMTYSTARRTCLSSVSFAEHALSIQSIVFDVESNLPRTNSYVFLFLGKVSILKLRNWLFNLVPGFYCSFCYMRGCPEPNVQACFHEQICKEVWTFSIRPTDRQRRKWNVALLKVESKIDWWWQKTLAQQNNFQIAIQ